jgi:hypothetical protein
MKRTWRILRKPAGGLGLQYNTVCAPRPSKSPLVRVLGLKRNPPYCINNTWTCSTERGRSQVLKYMPMPLALGFLLLRTENKYKHNEGARLIIVLGLVMDSYAFTVI